MNNNLWPDYQLLDSGNGQKLERFGKYILNRPEKDVIWQKQNPQLWNKSDAIFHLTSAKKGDWEIKTQVLDKWLMQYQNLKFWAKLTPYKHTGVFPEQATQWDWIQGSITKAKRPVKILNLFAYTGIATLAAAAAGAQVTHVDSSRPAITWFKDNQKASNLEDKPVRIILDDVMKFINREVKRGNHYDGILMDPPVYGHGTKGEKWTFAKNFPQLLETSLKLLSQDPLFLQVNTYTLATSIDHLRKDMQSILRNLKGNITTGQLKLPSAAGQKIISPAIFGRWESSDI